jgi:hypothetical protein
MLMNRNTLLLAAGALGVFLLSRKHPSVNVSALGARPNTPPMGGALNPQRPMVDTCITQPVGTPCVTGAGLGGFCNARFDCVPGGDMLADQDSMI